MSFAVAILGRPNVGKSTLFNRLVGSRAALVDNTPGLTRDRREGEGRIADLGFRAIDTAGLEEATPGSLAGRMQTQTERALSDADVVLLVIDAREGVTEADRHFAGWLRRTRKPVVLVANKAEGRAAVAGLGEAYRLGLGDPVPISAEHGEGMAALYERLAPFSRDATLEQQTVTRASPSGKPLHLAIVGRPNVGKSTLINRLIGEDRLLTGPEAGITRDAITVDWVWRDREIRLVDTAGMRRRPRVEGKIEKLSVADALRAIRFAETVVLVLDALQPLERQDLTIARLVADEGRALVLAVTKWDAVVDRGAALKALQERLPVSLPQLEGVSLVPVSGLTGLGLRAMMDAIATADAVWNKRIPTGELNRWLAGVWQHHPPPLVDGRRPRLRYIAPVNTRPPSFALFASKADELPASYRRYLVNALRKAFDLPGTPIRMMLRQGKNPYRPR
jgi:GTPase